jgi:hypothetical protein
MVPFDADHMTIRIEVRHDSLINGSTIHWRSRADPTIEDIRFQIIGNDRGLCFLWSAPANDHCDENGDRALFSIGSARWR